MAYCPKCGHQVEDGTKFCPLCGAPLEETKTVIPVEEDREKRMLGAFAFFSIFIIIYLAVYKKDDAFLKHYANQALIATIFATGFAMIWIVGWILLLVVLVFTIIAIIKAFKGITYTIPLIGKIRIFK